MYRNRKRIWLLVSCTAMLPALFAGGRISGGQQRQRAQPPSFPTEEFEGVFFRNLFQEALVGSRPPARSTDQAVATHAATDTDVQGLASDDSTGRFSWSKLVSSATLENEVKAIKLLVDQDVTTPAQFSGQGFKACRRHFSVLAMVFAIIGEYDADVRWKRDAPHARELFARAAANCKVGSPQAFNEAKQRTLELGDLVRGAALGDSDAAKQASWDKVVDRSPLMQRLEAATLNGLKPATASQNEFASLRDDILHQAELVAAIGQVLQQPGMEDADDETYAGLAKQMQQAALEIVEAVKQDNYRQASSSLGTLTKSCDQCHADYR